MERTLKSPLLGGHPALELVNTTMVVRGSPVDLIPDGRSFLGWLVDAGLLDATTAASFRRRFAASDLDAAAAEVRVLRAWARAWIARWSAEPEALHEHDLRKLNAWLLRADDHRELYLEDGRLVMTARLRGKQADELVGLCAAQIADLVTTETPALVKRCAGSDCTLWFVDRTKTHRRRFCSAAACGNREKVAAFRARQRSG